MIHKKQNIIVFSMIMLSSLTISPPVSARPNLKALDTHVFLANILSNRIPPSPSQWRISFLGSDTPFDNKTSHEIFQVNGDGNNAAKALTSFNKDIREFSWSPDGKKIAYRDEYEISLLDIATGSNNPLVTYPKNNNFDYINNLMWSPQGDAISYLHHVSSTGAVIVRYDLNSQNVMSLTSATISQFVDQRNNKLQLISDFWQSGDTLFSYVKGQSNDRAIEIMRSDGSHVTGLAAGYSPAWSPTYEQMAYIPSQGANSVRILTFDRIVGIKSDRELFRMAGNEYLDNLTWAPDGTGLLLNVSGSTIKVYRIKTDGSETTPTFIRNGHNPVWTPDSQGVIYSDSGPLSLIRFTDISRPITLTNLHSANLAAVKIAP